MKAALKSCGRRGRARAAAIVRGFTLIEVMVVVGIMGMILAAGIPSLYKLMQKEGIRKVTSDVVEVCSKARAQAIFRGTPVDVIFHPRERRMEVGSAPAPAAEAGGPEIAPERPTLSPATGQSAQIPEDMVIEMLDINLSEYRESEWARVRFFPNGTSDELTLVLHSSKNEWKKITLEVTTGLASVDNVQ
jgi:prepilin-type N-terminal cleavage/methylation domain-containing protein